MEYMLGRMTEGGKHFFGEKNEEAKTLFKEKNDGVNDFFDKKILSCPMLNAECVGAAQYLEQYIYIYM